MIPWKPLIVFSLIAVGATTLVALVTSAMRWTVSSPGWGLLMPFAMWAPAFARLIVRRTIDREAVPTLSLRRWGPTGAAVVLRPLAFPLIVYGASYAIAWGMGLVSWNPGEGKWTSGPQIAMNVVINLTALGIIGTFTAMGEEIGWRGYLQPRLDAARVRSSLVILWLVQLAYHAPLMAGAGYANVGGLTMSLMMFAIGDLSFTFLGAHEAYRARSLWPAVFFHSFHNTISQWLFPKFFTANADQIWVRGEEGVLPMIGYLVLGAAVYLAMRRRTTWQAFAQKALATPRETAAIR